MAPRVAAGENVAIVFGRERNGLENHEVALADRIVTLPVNPAFASLNLAQAVVIVGYEWFKCAGGGELPFSMPEKFAAGGQAAARRLLCRSRTRAGEGRILPPRGKARHHECQPAQYLSAHGADAAGHPHPAWRDHRDRAGAQRPGARRRAGCGAGARSCAISSPADAARAPSERTPLRGLPRLLRRNPTEAERILWQALVNDRRFAGRGFKRQVPIGAAHGGFCLVPAPMRDRPRAGGEKLRHGARRAPNVGNGLAAHDYKVIEVRWRGRRARRGTSRSIARRGVSPSAPSPARRCPRAKSRGRCRPRGSRSRAWPWPARALPVAQ